MSDVDVIVAAMQRLGQVDLEQRQRRADAGQFVGINAQRPFLLETIAADAGLSMAATRRALDAACETGRVCKSAGHRGRLRWQLSRDAALLVTR
jgi:hypothetical protein